MLMVSPDAQNAYDRVQRDGLLHMMVQEFAEVGSQYVKILVDGAHFPSLDLEDIDQPLQDRDAALRPQEIS